MSAHLDCDLRAGGLDPDTMYGASIKWEAGGQAINLGVSDQASNDNGRVIFDLAPAVFSAVSKLKGPGVLTMWVRAGGTTQTAPPVGPKYLVTLNIA